MSAGISSAFLHMWKHILVCQVAVVGIVASSAHTVLIDVPVSCGHLAPIFLVHFEVLVCDESYK
jgi:hypothetical protein